MSINKELKIKTSKGAARLRALQLIRNSEKVFIVHSHSDLKIAKNVYSKLLRLRKNKSTESVFLDQESLEPGALVTIEQVESHLAQSDLVVVLCGEDTPQRSIVSQELDIAVKKAELKQLVILPIIIREGLILPKQIDYKYQGIFLNNLFPEILWWRIAFVLVGIALGVLAIILILRLGWAYSAAPEHRWMPLPIPGSGVTDAVFVEQNLLPPTIRILKRTVERGMFAEDVDNLDHSFTEYTLSGELIGAFETTEDDAGVFIIGKENSGSLVHIAGKLEDDESTGEEIWKKLSRHKLDCERADSDWFLEEELDPVDVEKYDAFRCAGRHYLIFKSLDSNFDDSFHGTVSIVLKNKTVHSGKVELDPDGLIKIVKSRGSKAILFAVTSTTRWDQFGSVGGIFKSTDNGRNWERILESSYLSDLTISFNNTQRVAMVQRESENGFYVVKLSADQGNTWKIASEGLLGDTLESINLVGISASGEVVAILPGGRFVFWRATTVFERFMGIDDIVL